LWLGYSAFDHATVAQELAQRRGLDQRRAELTNWAAKPGSMLACLNGLPGNSVEAACEAAVFATPQSAAVAIVHAAARLSLLADSLAYARRFDASYQALTADLRRAVENDAYGLYAHVLTVRDGCTPERCPAFALLRDTSVIRAHMRERLYERRIAENSRRWERAVARESEPAAASAGPSAAAPAEPIKPVAAAADAAPAAPAAAAAAVVPSAIASTARSATVPTPLPRPSGPVELTARAQGHVPPVASVLSNIDFPSSNSIPPVSIMDPEPAASPATRGEAPGQAATRPAPNNPARPQ